LQAAVIICENALRARQLNSQVADSKTPASWQLDGVVFLSLEMQREMNLSILQHNLTASYARKMVGFLYAIRQGAQLIFETDDDNFPLEGDLSHLSHQPS